MGSDPGLTWNALGITICINVVIGGAYILLYSILSVQRSNARIYFCRWFVLDDEDAKKKYEGVGHGAIELNPKHYLHAFNWMLDSLRFNEQELMAHAGLDMVLYLRMFVMAWKIFVPIMVIACAVLLPIYISKGDVGSIDSSASSTSNLTQLTIGSLAPKNNLYWLVAVLAYVFNFWILYVLAFEFKTAAKMRLQWTSILPDRPNQFSVLVRQVPTEVKCDAPQETEKFFREMHPETYLLTQACYDCRDLPKLQPKLEYKQNRLEALTIRSQQKGERPLTSKGCCGPKVDAIDYMEEEVQNLTEEIKTKQGAVLSDPKAIIPACFVSFNSRRGAAVAAQTLQCGDPAQWVTSWAPEPCDVVWTNLSIPYLHQGSRKTIVAFIVFVIVVGYTIPIAIIQVFASLSFLEEKLPWLTPILEINFVNAFLTGFLPGLGLTIVLMVLPPILLGLSKWEGYVSQSEIDRAAAGKHFYFKLVTVFLANVLLGSALQSFQLIAKTPSMIPSLLGTAIPSQSTFFITFTLINGWCGIAAELFRGWFTLIVFHIKNWLLVTTPADRVKVMSAPSPGYFGLVPELEMYFLLSFMYMIVAPFYLPFVVVYYFWAYMVFRNQFINVYSPAYDLRGGFWPHFHARAIAMLVCSQGVLILIVALKQNIGPAIVLIPLPILTLMLNNTFIFDRYGAVFKRVPLDDATRKDREDAQNPENDPRSTLEGAYLHPSLKGFQFDDVEGAKGTKGRDNQPGLSEESMEPLMTSAPQVPVASATEH